MKRTMITLVILGMIIWVVAGIIGLLVGASSKFIWTCVTGFLLGFVGIAITFVKDRAGGV
jgi:hypothetical protein